MRALLSSLLLSLFLISPAQEIIRTWKIWDFAPHNAFTDLVHYRGSFYCTFREGESHVPKGRPGNGKVRILRSKNGVTWESAGLLQSGQYDLRDPKISVTPDNQLMVIMGGSDYTTGKLGGCLTHVSFSRDGLQFSDPQPVIIEEAVRSALDWIWRITWNESAGYGVLYQPDTGNGEIATRVVRTEDGIHYQLVSNLELTGKPNEATIRFQGNRMYILMRREGKDAAGLLGASDPPYRSWTWTDLGIRLGGPEFQFVNPNRIVLGTRLYRKPAEGGAKTGILYMDQKGKIGSMLELPSGGDTSYPGMVIYRGKLFVSYYSSHEGKTSVYLAKIRL